jgi:trk system potassium uptake protein TrkA
VGRTLGFKRIVTSIGDPQFEDICQELGLKDTIIPSRTITRYLVDMVGGSENAELSTVIKGEARLFILITKEEDAVAAKDLKLPAAAKVICYYRDGKFSHADEETTFRTGDEVVILTHSKNMPALQERWKPKPDPEESATEEPADSASKKNK